MKFLNKEFISNFVQDCKNIFVVETRDILDLYVQPPGCENMTSVFKTEFRPPSNFHLPSLGKMV